MDRQQLRSRFEEQLRLFCFFHLGFDARLQISEGEGGLTVRIAHHRVEPLQFQMTYQELDHFSRHQPELERFLLDQITPHRR